MNTSFSKFISLIFSPILMPLYMALIIVYAHPQEFTDTSLIHNDVRLMYFGAIVVLFPLVSLFFMKKLELFPSWQIEDPKQRFIPMIAIATFWLWSYFMFKQGALYKTSSYHVLPDMLLGCIISLFILFPLNFTSKLNFHTVGVGAVLGMLINIIPTSQYNLITILIISIVLGGLLVSAQMTLKNDDKNTLLFSFLIGFAGQFLSYQILSKFL